ncbi:membrane protein FxsA [Mycobacterium cookii]|uniref:Membrane protein FxsA n=1 Tax=Mycobacterium cookii TaxID=1775 RepID=A0A7I7KUR4_9MYCO|nr:FxsA family protein [Mycobacterium cookii]MCV7330948.1 FxsA family protein [Mycobacterium cookii]BBX45082.1 membrane protein FxsA [Mycobacterium cookii]
MVSRLFLVYVVVELLVVVGLASTIGLGWTLLAVLIAFAAGLTLAGSQLRLQLGRLRSGFGADPSRLATDSALVGLGSLLVVMPGLVTTAAGLLLLLPPGRAAARPLLTALAGRRFQLITIAADGRARRPDADYIDGEVIDVTEVEPPALPVRPE